ncbi:hypothetical protein [Flavobacterium sp.]|uniref:hypothetical protein n=1 Tax=Flavobacterium sp. TaxID=239 RepID=UPI002610C22E|nr:hypothetical protein [Flavobacterium sp.]MDG2432005.1 hypothetical protein [Flavobacterium sp.]
MIVLSQSFSGSARYEPDATAILEVDRNKTPKNRDFKNKHRKFPKREKSYLLEGLASTENFILDNGSKS